MLNFTGIPRAKRRGVERWTRATAEARDAYLLLDDDAVRAEARTIVARAREAGEGEDDLPGWFVEPIALAAVAAERTLGIRPHDTQLCAAVVLCDEAVAEMRTGEGKTLAASLAAAAYALSGRHVHVMTANAYLAARDAAWMGPVYDMLGVTAAALDDDDDHGTRQGRYRADVVYATAAQFGFDYLNDNRVPVAEAVVQHTRDVALIDEADALLLDDARTPLILSAPDATPGEVELIERAAAWAATLDSADVEVKPAERTVALSEEAIVSAASFFSVAELFDHPALAAMCIEAATARFAYHRDVDYVVVDRAVVIVDRSTGRLQPERRWRDGLHEALEAKERVEVRAPLPTVAMITVPSLLRLYRHVAAMTGTAAADTAEFEVRYGLTVCSIPTDRPVQRVDAEDLLFEDRETKIAHLVADAARHHETGRPVLIGAPTIADASDVSDALTSAGVTHSVLSARDPAAEASIIAAAGRPGAVTVATNMAGRGVDICLGGDLTAELDAAPAEERDRVAADHAQRRADVVAAGGLVVLATARHESRRTDDQLRGRAGRQGDPGLTQFYLALDDELIEHFVPGAARAAAARAARNGSVVSHSRMSALIAQAQDLAEARHRDARSELARVHVVHDAHREEFYAFRARTLTMAWDELVGDWFERGFAAALSNVTVLAEVAFEEYGDELPVNIAQLEPSAAQLAGLVKVDAGWLTPALSAAIDDVLAGFEQPADVVDRLADGAYEAFTARHEGVDEDALGAVLRLLVVSELDRAWTSHLVDLDALARGIHLRGSAGLDWRTAWVHDAHEVFVNTLDRVSITVARMLLAATVDIVWDDDVSGDMDAVEGGQDSVPDRTGNGRDVEAPESQLGSVGSSRTPVEGVA